MNTDYFSIKGKNGAFFVYKPHQTDDPEFIIVVATGLAEHAARYNRLSSFLKNHNVQLYCIDHLGQGIYATSLGIWPVNGFTECVSNINSLIEYIHEKNPGKKIVLFGHSMGSFMSLSFIEQYAFNIDACILSGTNDQQPYAILKSGMVIASIQQLFLGRNKPSKILNALSFGQ
ncbi:MAG: alpha/beta fold hydrolase, partial [Clostridia bacterium]